MRIRRIVFFLILINFILGLIGALGFLSALHRLAWYEPLLSFLLILWVLWAIVIGFCMVCIAYWVAEDERLNSGFDYMQSPTRQKWEETHRNTSEKLGQLPRSLIDKYAEKGYANPELFLEHEIAEKMASGKTKQQAIEEMDKR